MGINTFLGFSKVSDTTLEQVLSSKMYCEQNFSRGTLKVWAPVFPLKRAVLYPFHNWSFQNKKWPHKISYELLTDHLRNSRRHHVHFEVTCGPVAVYQFCHNILLITYILPSWLIGRALDKTSSLFLLSGRPLLQILVETIVSGHFWPLHQLGLISVDFSRNFSISAKV